MIRSLPRALPAAPRAARLTAVVLLAGLLRVALSPLGPMISTAGFGAFLWVIFAREGGDRATEPTRWGRSASVIVGVIVGFFLIAPLAHGTLAGRPLQDFWAWAAAAAVIAVLEEAVIRGPLQKSWSAERGPIIGLMASAAVFAAIHLPRYGMGAMPLDLAVGLALAGLRMLSGRVLPSAVAHTLADWGAWFFA